MKRLFCILLSVAMLLSLAACGAAETEPAPSPEEQAFQAACALLDEGKYQEAYAAFTALESYRKVQEKIDACVAGIDAAWQAEEEAAKQELLQQVDYLYGTAWRDTRSSAELTFAECSEDGTGSFTGQVHYLDWIDSTTKREADYPWFLMEGDVFISYLPCLPRENIPEEGFPVTVEERNGVTHLLMGDCDFVRNEDYAPYEPAPVEITLDNWQEYFEVMEGPWWQYDDFGVRCDVYYTFALCLKEEYSDRILPERSSVAFGYTYDTVFKSISQLDFDNAVLKLGGTFQLVFKDQSNTLVTYPSFSSYPNFPFSHCMGLISQGTYVPGTRHFVDTIDNLTIDRVAGTLMLRPE